MKTYLFRPGLIKLIMLLLVISAGCTGNNERKYYISSAGNDSWSGKNNRPWRSIQRLNRQRFIPGDMILLEGGAVFPGTLKIGMQEGNDSSGYIAIASYGSGRAVIDGGDSSGLVIKNASRFKIKNISVKGNGRKNDNASDGIVVDSCSDFLLDSIDVSGFQHSGVLLRDCRNARLTNITAHDNGFAGIHVTSVNVNHPEIYGNENIYIGYSLAYNNPGDPTVVDNHSGNGILVSSVKGGIIEFCEACNNGWDMPWTGNGPVGIWIWDCTQFIIRNSVSHHNKTNPVAKDGGGFDLDGGVSNSVIENCISYNNYGAGYGLFEFGAAKPWRNNIIRNNISYNDGILNEGSVAVWKDNSFGSMQNCEIYNNTFINDTLRGIAYSATSNIDGVIVKDNVFVFTGSLVGKGQKILNEKFISNIFWNPEGKVIVPPGLEDANFVKEPDISDVISIVQKMISEKRTLCSQ